MRPHPIFCPGLSKAWTSKHNVGLIQYMGWRKGPGKEYTRRALASQIKISRVTERNASSPASMVRMIFFGSPVTPRATVLLARGATSDVGTEERRSYGIGAFLNALRCAEDIFQSDPQAEQLLKALIWV